MSDGDWVKEASEDKALVVEILLKLSKEPPPPPPPPPRQRGRPAPPLGWSVRQPRSRSQAPAPAPAPPPAPARSDKKPEVPVASPSTPLSWSGATSMSGGGAGAGAATADAVESSQQIHNRSDVSRSKVTPPSETTPTKRSRKRKSLAKLKGEEMSLIEEQQLLKRQIATLQASFEEQRKDNEVLKMKMKMKLNTQTQPHIATSEAVKSGGTQQTIAAEPFPVANHPFSSNVCEGKFALPDLNVPAVED